MCLKEFMMYMMLKTAVASVMNFVVLSVKSFCKGVDLVFTFIVCAVLLLYIYSTCRPCSLCSLKKKNYIVIVSLKLAWFVQFQLKRKFFLHSDE